MTPGKLHKVALLLALCWLPCLRCCREQCSAGVLAEEGERVVERAALDGRSGRSRG